MEIKIKGRFEFEFETPKPYKLWLIFEPDIKLKDLILQFPEIELNDGCFTALLSSDEGFEDLEINYQILKSQILQKIEEFLIKKSNVPKEFEDIIKF